MLTCDCSPISYEMISWLHKSKISERHDFCPLMLSSVTSVTYFWLDLLAAKLRSKKLDATLPTDALYVLHRLGIAMDLSRSWVMSFLYYLMDEVLQLIM